MVHVSERRSRAGAGRIVLGGLAAVTVALAVARLGGLIPSFSNPFGTEAVDRSQPALLESLVDLSEYRAASGNFQVIVDVEKDAKLTPAFLRGERTVFVAAGEVGASVDFSRLDQRSITTSADRRSVTVKLPAPTVTEPRIDPEQSRVVARQRGLLDRLGSVFADTPTGEQRLYLMAEDKMRAAARESDLRTRAQDNTRTMLEGMLRALGYTSVTVTFADSSA